MTELLSVVNTQVIIPHFYSISLVFFSLKVH